jgi:glycosyltransferase involved in cell wall biosynthesis
MGRPPFGLQESEDQVDTLRIAMVGTRGVPARYGGFETAVEEVGRRLAERGHRVVVYCRTVPGAEERPPAEHLGMELVHLPAARKRALETLSHTALSVAHLVAHRTDAAIVFNAANSPLLPVLRAARIPVATHVDGLEWKRAKWGPTGRRYYRAAEALAVRWSDALIADAQGIADYYRDAFSAPTSLLTYGAPLIEPGADRLAELGLEPRGYHLVVARFEPENHVDVIVEGYAASTAAQPLVVVGSAPYADEYTRRVHALADDRVRFLGGVWDQQLLDQLYANCSTYLHGHSVGGTNPSLLRAIGAGAAVTAFDVDFNREVVADAGRFFRTPQDVARQVAAVEADPEGVLRAGRRARELAGGYDWDQVAAGYEELARRLADRRFPGRRPSGRRTATAADGPPPPTPSPAPDAGMPALPSPAPAPARESLAGQQ